jgi:dTDP-4-amino-4,6-dideoxygalactose transaminase
VAAVLASGELEHGRKVEQFEAALRVRIRNPHLVAVNSATSGLTLAVRLAAGSPGEVLSTPLTFEATNWAIRAAGLRIRWVDVDPATLNVDLDDLGRKITPATRAVVVVHWTGYPVDLDRLAAVLDRAEAEHGIRPVVIEDCAHAWGATYHGAPLGTHGNIAVFSFQAIKHLTCGAGGGVVVLPDAAAHRRARRLRWFGIDRTADRVGGSYDIAEWGYRFQMTEIAAGIGLANLALADRMLLKHRDNARFFDKELADVPGLEQTERADDREPAFWMYPLKVDRRGDFMRKLADAGVMTTVMVRRNDAHSCVPGPAGRLAGLDSVQDRVVHLPVGWWLSEDDRAHVVDTIRSGW